MSREIQQITDKIKTLGNDSRAVLATVVDVEGSSYRLPGAKMLILENGETFGTVSGGCLEADVLERAQKVLKTGEPQIFIYDTTSAEDSVFSLNMGCRGVIRILLEPIRDNKFIEFLHSCFKKRKKGVSATLISPENCIKIGTRFMLDENENFQNNFAEELRNQISENARQVLADEKSALQTYEFGEIFYEYIAPTIALTIFGAGADAVPLVEIAKNLGWYVSVIDHRPAFASAERFANADRVILKNSESLSDEIPFDRRTAAVMMTHNYERDRDILANLLKTEIFYLGALGPKRRTEKLLSELTESGKNFSESQLEKFHAPIGLDIGADTPEAIALSIAAEIQAVLKEREGGFLRNRKGSIYGRN